MKSESLTYTKEIDSESVAIRSVIMVAQIFMAARIPSDHSLLEMPFRQELLSCDVLRLLFSNS